MIEAKNLLICIGLEMSHTPFIVCVLIIGIFSKHQLAFIELLPLLFFNIMLNGVLKKIIGKPLPQHLLSTSFAMPSGHMQTVALMWSYIILKITKKSLLTYMPIIIIIWVAYAIISANFHDVADIIAAIVVAVILAAFYVKITHIYYQHRCSIILILGTLTTILYFFTSMDSFKTVMLILSAIVNVIIYLHIKKKNKNTSC